MATGLRSKTFTLNNLQATGGTASNVTFYTCPASKYAEVLVAYLSSTSGPGIIRVKRAIPSGFATDIDIASSTGPNQNFERGDGTIFTPVGTAIEPKIRLYPGDVLTITNSFGNYEYRVIVEEISAN